jgi:hypothetical protein
MKKHTCHLPIFLLLFVLFNSCTKEKSLVASESKMSFFSLNGSELVEKTILLSNGNIAMTGAVNKNGFIAVFEPSGKTLWYKEIGGSESDWLLDIIETSDGNLVAVGETLSPSEGVQNENNADGWMVNYSATGALNWKRTVGSEEYYEAFTCVIETTEGDFVAAGLQAISGAYTYTAMVSKDGSKLIWDRSKRVGPWHSIGQSLVLDSKGGIMIAGVCSEGAGAPKLVPTITYLGTINLQFGIITSFDMYTDFIREQTYTQGLGFGAKIILQNEPDGYSWTTFMEGPNLSAQIQYAKVDFNRKLILERKYSGIGHINFRNTLKLKDGGYLICGETSPQPMGASGLKNTQATIFKIDNQGEVIWSSILGSSSSSQAALIANFENETWTVYSSNRDPETASLSFTKYKTDNSGNVIK